MSNPIEASTPTTQQTGTTPAPAATTPAGRPQPDPKTVAALLARKRAPSSEKPSSGQPSGQQSTAASHGTSSPTSTAGTPGTSTASTTAGQAAGQASATSGDAASKPEGDAAQGTDDAGGDPVLAKRLAKLAKAEDRTRRDREALEAERNAHTEDLAKIQAFKEARTQRGRLAALRVLFDDGEITTDLYKELTDHILEGDGKLSKEDADALFEKKLAAEKKKEAEDKQKAEGEREQRIKNTYVSHVGEAFDATPDKWPLVKAIGVKDVDIHAKVEDHYRKTGKTLRPAEALDELERDLDSKIEASGKYARTRVDDDRGGKQPNGSTTVTSSWTRDQADEVAAPDKPVATMSLKEAREHAKRKHGLLRS